MQIESVSPVFTVDDLAASLDFYVRTLGFELAWSWGEPPHIASVCRNGAEIMLSQRTDPGTPGAAQIYLGVSDIDAWYNALTSAGVEVRVPIGDRPYGMRDFRIVDPSGNELSFGEPIAGVT
ncbi:VOC family protein [Luteimonas fraxinea]|uniref:Bleomycin resistance protein n=1 Tax=Luteimonas fraxinea TaxID=2901869 RepID=A0ABS8UIW5_9GAMM|nr:VOC family protein [Luteimonas fraxinea]MCD9098628.1 VOC family protein [Luteimonas fraxinea]UHH08970.1 VOC family protein [Luteimonas fraxinea]